MAFIDEVTIKVQGGHGGKGCMSFRREKFIPRGGPDGGCGGDGGSVYLLPTHDKASLLDFKFQPKFEGKRGQHGKGSDMDGRSGEDLIVGVPVGTLVYNNETGELLKDLTVEGELFPVAKGGRGGRGNMTYVTSTNRAPRKTTPGEPGEALELKLELRLIADVGLIGLPNAGKSSFLRVVSEARPKVADYPFTTLEFNFGVVSHKGHKFVMADLPGLIEGAADGAGLGHLFLRHASRTRVLLHLVDVHYPFRELTKHIQTIRKELHAYDPSFAERDEILVFTKCDLLSERDLKARKEKLIERGLKGHFISSQTGIGRDELLTALVKKLPIEKPAAVVENSSEISDEEIEVNYAADSGSHAQI
jgi:GTP-binding protein